MSSRTIATLFLTLQAGSAVAAPPPPSWASIAPTDHQLSSALEFIIADYPGHTNVCVFPSREASKGPKPSLQAATDLVVKHGEQKLFKSPLPFLELKSSLRMAVRLTADETLHYSKALGHKRCRASLIIEEIYANNDTVLIVSNFSEPGSNSRGSYLFRLSQGVLRLDDKSPQDVIVF